MITLAPLHNARMRNIWTLRLFTFAVWLLAAASAIYWVLQISARAAPDPALARADVATGRVDALLPETLAVAHGLGAVGDALAAPQQQAGSSGPDWSAGRFVLSGILAQGSEADGLVMLSVDGKPVQLLRLGQEVEPQVVVQALSRQSVTLANIQNKDQPQLLTLTLGQKAGEQSSAAASVPPPAPPALVQPAPVPNPVPNSAPEAAPPAQPAQAETQTREQEREERRERLAERIAERRNAEQAAQAANNPATNPVGNAAAPARVNTPAPRRSVLADDSLYFSD